MVDKKDKEFYMLNEKDREFYENHAKELTEKYLKDHCDLKFIPVYSIDEFNNIPTITMKLVKKEESSDEKDDK